jgi:hypothetical protein
MKSVFADPPVGAAGNHRCFGVVGAGRRFEGVAGLVEGLRYCAVGTRCRETNQTHSIDVAVGCFG